MAFKNGAEFVASAVSTSSPKWNTGMQSYIEKPSMILMCCRDVSRYE
jgi:hypothetical protein